MPDQTFEHYVKLSELPYDKEGTITNIDAGKGLKRRMYSMNIRPGKKVKMISSFWSGPVTFETNRSSYTIGRGIANKIIVGYHD